MGRILVMVVALTALWLLLSGYFDKPLLLIFGAGSVAFATWLAHRARVLDAEGIPGGVFPGIFGYWIWLTVEIGKANLIVARQALAVEPKLSPKLFLVPNPPRSAIGKVILGNSITMTPGTVTVDLREDAILVHGLTEALSDEESIRRMGERVAGIERKG